MNKLNSILFNTIILTNIFVLSSCSETTFFYDANFNDNINIPLTTISQNGILDLDTVEKFDANSLLPPVLKRGSEHQIITSIQSKLMSLGYMDEDKPTTYYGESTEMAIKKLQRQIGLEENGICDALVYDYLMLPVIPTYEVKRGFQGDDIKILQQQLYELNYLLYPEDVNGYYGEKTETAVNEMQKSNDLKVTGTIDLTTLNYLYSEEVKAYTIDRNSAPSVIKTYQLKLQDLGYYFGACNGKYTDEFRMAVRTYQVNNSQTADGYIGPSTKFSLDSKYAKPFSMFMGQSSESVKNVQIKLIQYGYLEERMATGYYGEFTAQAVALFQQENNLPVTGSVDGATNIVLNSNTAIPSPTGPIKFVKQFIIDTLEIQKQIEESKNVGNVEDLLKVAKLKLGSKYVWGSRGPKTFDCSGFVYWCLNQIGVNISYMTTYNWRFSTQFERVEKFEDLIPGDLIVINGHMGIVAENETVIDASSSNGKVVHRDLDDWWRERFIIGFRIFSQENSTTNIEEVLS